MACLAAASDPASAVPVLTTNICMPRQLYEALLVLAPSKRPARFFRSWVGGIAVGPIKAHAPLTPPMACPGPVMYSVSRGHLLPAVLTLIATKGVTAGTTKRRSRPPRRRILLRPLPRLAGYVLDVDPYHATMLLLFMFIFAVGLLGAAAASHRPSIFAFRLAHRCLNAGFYARSAASPLAPHGRPDAGSAIAHTLGYRINDIRAECLSGARCYDILQQRHGPFLLHA